MFHLLGTGHLHGIHVSDGGVPKLPVEDAEIGIEGLAGDRQAHPEFHGGPDRAVCLLGLDVIERLAAEGHPIAPGGTGENLTVAGLDWARVVPGARLRFEGGVELEAVSYAVPCGTIRASFTDGRVQRISAERHPGESRVYARVLHPGRVRRGEACRLLAATDA